MRSLLPLVLLLASGCSMKNRSIPDAPLRFASADYTVLGATSAEACGTYVFAIDWQHLFADTQGSISTPPAGTTGWGVVFGALGAGKLRREEGRALYDALGRMPEATNLYAPRFETENTGLVMFGKPVFGRRCAMIEAQGVRLGEGPVPNAH